MKKIKWHIFITTFIIAMILISGGYLLHERYFRENPLKYTLESIEEVNKVEIKRDGKIHLDIFMSYTPEFPRLVNEIEGISDNHINSGYTFTIHDKASPRLSDFKNVVTPALFEGARNGNYRAIQETARSEAERFDFEECIFMVDNKRIYLQAKDGDSYLYMLVPLYPENIGNFEDYFA